MSLPPNPRLTIGSGVCPDCNHRGQLFHYPLSLPYSPPPGRKEATVEEMKEDAKNCVCGFCFERRGNWGEDDD